MANSYEKFLHLLSKWPVNPNKSKSMDFGHHLRQIIKRKDVDGNVFSGNREENLKKIDSLLNLAYNTYGIKNECNQKKGASGFELKTMNEILKKEFPDLA